MTHAHGVVVPRSEAVAEDSALGSACVFHASELALAPLSRFECGLVHRSSDFESVSAQGNATPAGNFVYMRCKLWASLQSGS